MSRLSLLLASSLLAVALTGCAVRPDESFVERIEAPADAQVLATGMVDFVVARLPAASSTVVLDPTPSDQAGNALTPAFVAALRQHGFAVADSAQVGTAGVHRLRYWVSALDNGTLIRLSLDGSTEAARFFVRNTAGGLQPGGPFMVREAEAGT